MLLLALVILACWTGVARAQIDDISSQMGVNTTTSLSPGVDPTGVHRDFDPGKRPVKPGPGFEVGARTSTNANGRTNQQATSDNAASAANVVRGHVGGAGAETTKGKVASERNRRLLHGETPSASPPQSGRKTTAGAARNVTARQGALLEPMAETRKP